MLLGRGADDLPQKKKIRQFAAPQSVARSGHTETRQKKNGQKEIYRTSEKRACKKLTLTVQNNQKLNLGVVQACQDE